MILLKGMKLACGCTVNECCRNSESSRETQHASTSMQRKRSSSGINMNHALKLEHLELKKERRLAAVMNTHEKSGRKHGVTLVMAIFKASQTVF